MSKIKKIAYELTRKGKFIGLYAKKENAEKHIIKKYKEEYKIRKCVMELDDDIKSQMR